MIGVLGSTLLRREVGPFQMQPDKLGTFFIKTFGSLTNGQKVIIEDGVAKLPDRSAFAGSVATADRLVRTMISIAGIPLIDAIRMITLTPARILHVDSQKGSLEEGKDADIVIFDNQINVTTTISKGHVIYNQ